MTSAVDVTVPSGPRAFTSDVRGNFLIIRDELTALQDVLGPREASSYDNYSLWVNENVELDVGVTGDENCSAWLFTDDNDGTIGSGSTGQAGVGTGQSTGGAGISGGLWIWTGDAIVASGQLGIGTGNVAGPAGQTSGNIAILSGNAVTRSGDIRIGIGQAAAFGDILLEGYKTADPHVPGAVWCDPAAGRVLKVSAG